MTLPREEVLARARKVKALVLDVDGVLTDASLFYGARGEAMKAFSARDGFAVKLAQSEGLRVAILSGRQAPPLKARLRDLGIPRELAVEGSRDKKRDLARLAARLGLRLDEVAYMGDDLPDLPAIADAGLSACPGDATGVVCERCHHVCRAGGGHGAVREMVELILAARGRWDVIVESWSEGTAAEGFFARSEPAAGHGD
ncbi:MAG TPA: HAD family hydrolase [Thermoanaerobaculaceae bacterium]|nr:HAD family hydrolase [Thermoanaerobaculaceae bacterium]